MDNRQPKRSPAWQSLCPGGAGTRRMAFFMLGVTMALTACEDRDETHPEDPAVPERLSVQPARVTLDLATETHAVFTASGGTPPYRWSVSDASLGHVADTSAGIITYTAESGAAGANVVTVQDRKGWTVEAIVLQVTGTGTTP